MKQFATLVNILGTSTKTNDKLEALSDYFAAANDKDKVWVIALFSGRRPRRTINSTLLQQWCAELVGFPLWLFEESYHTVGDLSETIALLIPDSFTDEQAIPHPLHYYVEKFQELSAADEETKKTFMLQSWRELATPAERFVFNKLLSGAFRIGVSQKLMVNALAKTVKLDPSVIAHRISGNWDPASIAFEELLSETNVKADFSKPYPFYLAYALETAPDELGKPEAWQAEWKWDGIRGQLIKRNNELFVWSRGEELLTDKFPEYAALKELLSQGCVLDGEILPYNGEMPLPFAALQTRIGRKNVTKKQLQEAPVAFFAYDVLEYEGEDFRNQPMEVRRKKLEEIVEAINHPTLKLSPVITFDTWENLAETRSMAREVGSEGLMLKRKDSVYQD
ncbi:MAG: ATP-dependent DNA ligase, partial [Chitinophagaceae bacterium]